MAIVQNILDISGKSLERTASLLFHLNSALCRTITWQTSTSRLPWTNTLLVSNNISLVCLIILLHFVLSLEKNTIISFKKNYPKSEENASNLVDHFLVGKADILFNTLYRYVSLQTVRFCWNRSCLKMRRDFWALYYGLNRVWFSRNQERK